MKLQTTCALSVAVLISAVVWWSQHEPNTQLPLSTLTTRQAPTLAATAKKPEALETQQRVTGESQAGTDSEPVLREIVSAAFPKLLCRTQTAKSTNENGATVLTNVCKQLLFPEPDVYGTYSSEELEKQAYDDPRAAQLLAIRSAKANPTRSLKYAVRATALSNNDALPLVWYMQEVRPKASFSYTPRSNIESVKMNYVLSSVAHALDSRARMAEHARWREELSNTANAAELVTTLDQHIKTMLSEIFRIQQEVGIDPTKGQH